MEQVIWLYAGVITALFALAIIGTLFLNGQEQMKTQQIENSIKQVKNQADFLCGLEPGTLLTQELVLGSGSELKIGTDPVLPGKACVSYKGKNTCVEANCDFESYDLNLSASEYFDLFSVHAYKCTFEKLANGVRVNCKG
jgi:hypothetical protein